MNSGAVPIPEVTHACLHGCGFFCSPVVPLLPGCAGHSWAQAVNPATVVMFCSGGSSEAEIFVLVPSSQNSAEFTWSKCSTYLLKNYFRSQQCLIKPRLQRINILDKAATWW